MKFIRKIAYRRKGPNSCPFCNGPIPCFCQGKGQTT